MPGKAMNLRMLCVFILATGLCSGAMAKESELSRLPPPSDQKGVTFAKQIKPIFEASCVKCHSGRKPKGKLELDSREHVLAGSQDGDVVEPGDSAHSVLVQNVAHLGDKEDWMPPPKNKMNIHPLSRAQIALIRAWIDQGAK